MHGQTVLITGGAKRLGRATALALARDGFDVLVHYNDSGHEAATLVDELHALGVSAWAVQAAFGDAESCAGFLKTCHDTAGAVHHLINNASTFPEDTLEDLSAESLNANMAINTMAPFMLSKELKDTGTLKSITNLLDARILDYDRGHVSYHLSKRALMSLTSMMALEWAPEVRCNAVAPGLILPPEGEDEDYLKKLAHTNPLQSVGTEGDITEAIRFLIKSAFITGQIIYVDGGRHLKGRVYE